jgi:hypothetical protein
MEVYMCVYVCLLIAGETTDQLLQIWHVYTLKQGGDFKKFTTQKQFLIQVLMRFVSVAQPLSRRRNWRQTQIVCFDEDITGIKSAAQKLS